ncbi:hypothetical protein [Halorussus halophilus]|uniref:hypothetical protein n=1 Tax=Halorussus halophilus TaxID=2650975 RepID=UPI0013019565|nr:hypothetical protein [Halorussus halophilus]
MVSFNAHADGLEVVDPIERRRFELTVGRRVRPETVPPSRFAFPVDAAVAVATDSVVVDGITDAYVRRDGEMVAAIRPESPVSLPAGEYEVEVNAPVKLYLRGVGPLEATNDGGRLSVSFADGLLVGARSYHEQPAATITTTTDPEDALRAVSYLGSALKTTSVERSYPTLRGHPPLVELGDEFSVPEPLSKPDTGVEISVPQTHRAAVVAAPLAFYLGAELVPGTEPRIEAENGFSHALGDDTDDSTAFDQSVARVLKQTFFFDCITRTEGYYEVDLHERAEVEPLVDLDFPALYDASLAERLKAYLEVPFETIEEFLPRWNVTAFVDPDPAGVEAVPFVVGDLAVVRPADGTPVSTDELRSSVLDDFMSGQTRSGGNEGSGDDSESGNTEDTADRGEDDTTGEGEDDTDEFTLPAMVRPPEADSVESAWFGDGIPFGASKATTVAFRNWLDRQPNAEDIDITVVCNDATMRAEDDAVSEAYGTRDNLPFEVTFHYDLTRSELRDVLTSETDFLHYIGHIDDDGFDCADGSLDARTLETVEVDAFLLNACTSYGQGMALLEGGSVGGVVTFSEVIDSGAMRVGATMARLLNFGFPLNASLTVARGESIVGGHYLVVGDGRFAVVQSETSLPMLCELDAVSADEYDLTVHTYAPREGGMGTLARPTVGDDDSHFLVPGPIGPFRVTAETAREYLEREHQPVKQDGVLRWLSDGLEL